MRPGTFLAAAVLLLAGALAQGAFLRPTEAETTSTPAISPAFIVSHLILAGACNNADLHVIRYLPEGANPTNPLVATYCA